ncbi:response regulator UvrY [mine drainage metagenome]|uniref:Response regulator UvrY n=1 Tax=mine drainage metagenome TaxID=410659 RepID=A0A1J5T168_9ZZZZ
MKVRVLLVDDHKMFRYALRLILEKEPHIEIVGEAGDGQEMLALAHKIVPDVVCMDISMPHMDGIDATRRLLAINSSIRVIGLSANADQYYVMEMMNAGAAGYITKAESVEEILRAINTVHHSQKKYLCPDIAAHVVDAVFKPATHESTVAKLSHREQQVLHLVAEGCSSSSIAQRLQLSSSTVEVHRRNIMHKLNLHSIADLTKYAIRNGITSG